MAEPVIHCPSCKNEVKLTESLAAPLVESIKKQYQLELAQKDLAIANREEIYKRKEEQLKEAQKKLNEQIETQVQEQLKKERNIVAAEEAKKARLALGNELESKASEVMELQAILKAREEKLAAAQKVQADLLRQQRELEDAKREMDLTIEKSIQEGLAEIREKARREAEGALQLKVQEKEETILAMQKQIEQLKQKAEQGSQQLQGEVQELMLENMLQAKFPTDVIESVPKGEFGGDILQRVFAFNGQDCGTILWESKRTKHWNEQWLTKLRDDQRAAKAEICVIVSQALPVNVETFEQIDGVWVTHPRAAFPVAMVLRQTLLDIAMVRKASEGQQTKTELVYQYLTGPRFRQRIEAIVEAFSAMQTDLDKERKAILKQWAKRHEQIERVMLATVGMYGDLQGIAGKSLQEIAGLDFAALEDDKTVEVIL
ncbi:coiled-coil protein [Legionella beliardensis]|uniref:Coiled-coil protein n=1 Tax=Legionella beliardensis TaxID=91822 RepID=A0A378I8N6_9GAMM|nr:DUF2130 domain-containing protein [Legionella beliardensis]STX28734.1 coiled-coil protein [Legionella beliardensis]